MPKFGFLPWMQYIKHSCYLAVEVHVLDFNLLMLQEFSQQWSNMCGYVEATSQRQEFQNVNGHFSKLLNRNIGGILYSSRNFLSPFCFKQKPLIRTLPEMPFSFRGLSYSTLWCNTTSGALGCAVLIGEINIPSCSGWYWNFSTESCIL